MHMETEVTDFINLPVYTNRGYYVGVVQNVQIDLPNRRVGALLLTRTNTKIVEGGHNIAVPYRWVAAVGDIVVLSTFPDRIAAPAAPEAETEGDREAEVVAA